MNQMDFKLPNVGGFFLIVLAFVGDRLQLEKSLVQGAFYAGIALISPGAGNATAQAFFTQLQAMMPKPPPEQ